MDAGEPGLILPPRQMFSSPELPSRGVLNLSVAFQVKPADVCYLGLTAQTSTHASWERPLRLAPIYGVQAIFCSS